MTLPDHDSELPSPEERVRALEAELTETRATIIEIVLCLAEALNLDESQRGDLALALEVEAGAPGTLAEFARIAALAAGALRD
ncbi:hypothetical protein T8T21_17325 (plasmid) [Limimaricola variabilis]|uniref:hypothetical protein n=1 Tax=Limimaricola variabilis TaxID=1492771 RepID=UPI002AC92089|nr:hypothetical protein [Limimaricola variabilis]WPY96514.1 hypothetical protein T8T21_17325 [Limimaricola variabilis]